jgi:hypothetical protein
MKEITKPAKKVVDILDLLKTDTASQAVILDIESLSDILTERETLYEEGVENVTLFEISREQNFSERVDRDKIISYYNYRILQRPNGRGFYDEVFLSSPNNICPYCTINAVKTIDHFLPKAEYPSYSITPSNLVPSCRDCNLDKKVIYPTSSNDQTFHPYFDKVDIDCWLRAELQETEPLTFQYAVIRPRNWDEIKYDRATAHFRGYNINQLFSNEANRELRSLQSHFKSLRSKDRELLKVYLEEIYGSCLDGLGPIDWKTLMYQELSTNEWFLDGGVGNSFFI